MSLSNILDPATGSEEWKDLYVNKINVASQVITNGNIVVENDNPKISILNNATNANRAQLILNGRESSLSAMIVQQTETGLGLIENFNNNSDITILPHGSGNVILAPPTGFAKLSGASYQAVDSILTMNSSNQIIPSATLTGTVTLLAGGSSVGITTDINELEYTKIGNLVFYSVNLRMQNLAVGHAVGPLSIAGLPFLPRPSSLPVANQIFWSRVNFPIDYGFATGIISQGSSEIALFATTGIVLTGPSVQLTDVALNAGGGLFSTFIVSGIYFCA